MSDTEEKRPKRQKRESSYRAKAFEKFKQLKTGKRNRYEEEEVDNVYEIVNEREYEDKVISRQDDDWIVDDDGSGYIEDGRDIFDDDLDMESIRAASTSKGKGIKRKKKQISENAGKGNLQYLLSKMPAKKKEVESVGSDDVLSELLKEVDDVTVATPKKKKLTGLTSSVFSAKKAAMDYAKSLHIQSKKPSTITRSSPIVKPLIENQSSSKEEIKVENIENIDHDEVRTPIRAPIIASSSKVLNRESLMKPKEEIIETQSDVFEPSTSDTLNQCETQTTNLDMSIQDFMDDDDLDLDISQLDEIESKIEQNIAKANEDLLKDFHTDLNGDFKDGGNCEMDETDVLEGEKGGENVFRFFWWDAFEDASKQPGVVFLFGKTYCEETKAYISCCVAVRNIERRLYFLPRTLGTETDTEVTTQDVYLEISEKLMKQQQIKHFKARPIAKKYVFDLNVPVESDYVEVRYSAQDPGVLSTTTGKTFSRVFGTESTYLEIFLLERKIKGPCWLDVTSAVKVSNPITWCKVEMDCLKVNNIAITPSEKSIPPPPLVVSSINLRRAINPKTSSSEIVLISCITQLKYLVNKQVTESSQKAHFCIITSPDQAIFPPTFYDAINSHKTTTIRKTDTEKALLNVFINEFSKLDPDIIVGHDLLGYQIQLLSERLTRHQCTVSSQLGRIRRSQVIRQKLEKELFVGRLVVDVKVSAKELIKSRSYDLDALCQAVLKMKEGDRVDIEPEEIPKLYRTCRELFKLITITMKDTLYIMKILYHLNIIPLALQITNIAGNVMSRTLLGGRSERNEFLLLHAFSEKNYIVPDKTYKKKDDSEKSVKKKAAYSGGLVLEPKVGFYDQLILLMDFNSLYPSIIQEYNICFTTMPPGLSEDNIVLPDSDLPPGILPTEIRKLVESRREVKKLMNNPDINRDLYNQYHIRQMALKLTANSMYGCLGFSNSRFYAKNLAALITHKGREILTNTRDMVEALNYTVIYGDTDSLMINTNIKDFDQVFKIGHAIKNQINRLYKKVELDIDGVFKYLLLLKKKKYAAVTLSKDKHGKLKSETEYKGLDVVRRDWSQLSAEAGKFILNQILSDQTSDERIENIHQHLVKLKEDLENDRVPVTLLVITKQLTKNPNMYPENNSLPHVQVALRYNEKCGGHLRAGDTVPYVICDDGTSNAAMHRAYHVEELKSNESLKIDVKYYLAQQIHPVVSRICSPIEGVDHYQIAEWLGLDTSSFKKPKQKSDTLVENITAPEVMFRNADKFVFKCLPCGCENFVSGPLNSNNLPILEQCENSECKVRPVDYLGYIQNQLTRAMNDYIGKYYDYVMMCEDPVCPHETSRLPILFSGRFPVCTLCNNAIMIKKYTEHNLYTQLSYFQYIFDLDKIQNKPIVDYRVKQGYQELKEMVTKRLQLSGYSIINLAELFSGFMSTKNNQLDPEINRTFSSITINEADGESDDGDVLKD